MAVENQAAVVFIPIRVITADFEDLPDEAPAGAAFEMHHDIHGITDICFDRAVRQVHPTLQHATREAGQGLLGRSCMYGRKTP